MTRKILGHCLALGVMLIAIQSASAAESGDKSDLLLLEKFITNAKGVDFYTIFTPNSKCRKMKVVEHTPGDNVRFSVTNGNSEGYFGVGGRNGYTTYFPTVTDVERSGTISDSRAIQCAKFPDYRKAAYSKSIKTKEGIPFVWVFKNVQGFCLRKSVLPGCRVSCLQRVPEQRDVFAIAMTKEVAEKVSGGQCY